ncbi:hypothetical protein HGT70_04825 [Rosenbergiella collisarenosi]|uniref:hypothetical protein n=1 Tax=Rosenbergiella collisarenosi TaxID=1544695 RepID=UPI001BD9B391|nr:hypothetical protein [Rosenbergiella collisarenosi]MBT0720608.1 hypothetical protein [Rosenbergiella collisarenosi]
MNNTGNAVPSTSVLDFVDNVQILDQLINSDALEIQSRLGISLRTIKYLQNILGGLNLGDTYADISTGITATQNGTYFRVPQGVGAESSFIYYLNNNGTATEVARTPGTAVLESGVQQANGKDIASVTSGLVIYYDGTTTSDSAWLAYFVPVKFGDVVTYFGPTGSATNNEKMGYLIQCDSAKAFVASLTNVTSTGDITVVKTLSGTATQDGYIYVRVRASVLSSISISRTRKTLVTEAEYLNNVLSTDSANDAGTSYETGVVINSDGTVNNAAGNAWQACYVVAPKGTTVTYDGEIGSLTSGEVLCYVAQLDSKRNFVSSLANFTSTGTSSISSISGTSTQDGIIYVRFRVTSPAGTLTINRPRFAPNKNILSKWSVTDYTAVTANYVDNQVMYSGGSVVTVPASSLWRMYYLPCKAGDIVSSYGQVGSNTAGEKIAYIMQLDANKQWVSDLNTFTSLGSGKQSTTTLTGVATQDGYVAVRARIVSGITNLVRLSFIDRLARLSDIRSMATSTASSASVAKVFNAPWHKDLSNLPEANPDFSGFSSPLNYTFRKQWARRDFYNAADSYMLSYMSLDNNPWNSQSNIYNIMAGGVFTASWNAGTVSFSAPTANGKAVMFADKYNPFATSEIAIGSIKGNATLGIMYGDTALSNYVAVRVNAAGAVICEVYVSGTLAGTTTYSASSFAGTVLQVQNTGLALLIKQVNANGTWSWVGRYSYSSLLDARKLTFLEAWKTFVFAQTDTYTAADIAAFTGFSSRIASGSNSVSIRFLTYEDGTFIQRGKWMYYLVEGTGTTIADLFTQIVRINFDSGEVQMIGMIIQVRTDGTDSGIAIADDSIKVVYDRNSKTWKGISCGMDYAGTLSSDNLRPKLYFETKQDLFQGGVVLIKNSKQLLNSDGSSFGVGSNYVEDIDFYYDATTKTWVLTGNTVSSGCKTFRSPTLYDGITQEFSTSSVPSGVRDTGNQFVTIGGVKYLTSGGSANKLHLRKYESGLTYLGELSQDIYLDPTTVGPWCTLVPYTNGDETAMYLLSFDRSDLYEGLGNGAATYDHGGLYCWKAE